MSSASWGEKKRLSRPETLELANLLGHALLQRLVELRQLAAIAELVVVEPLLLQAGAHPRLQQHGVERLAQVVVGAELDAPHHALHLVQGGDHEHGDVASRGIALDLLEHGEAVQVRHHDVEEDEVHGRAVRGHRAPSGPRVAVTTSWP
jgi:hypothetical protein